MKSYSTVEIDNYQTQYGNRKWTPKNKHQWQMFYFFPAKNNWSTLNPAWKKNVRQIVIKISAKKPWGRWWFVTLCIVLYIGGMLKCVFFSPRIYGFSPVLHVKHLWSKLIAMVVVLLLLFYLRCYSGSEAEFRANIKPLDS